MLTMPTAMKRPVLLAVLLSMAGILLALIAVQQRSASALGGTPGYINTFAGNGSNTYSGDGGPATSASIQGPGGLAMDGTTLIIADTYNCRIRQVVAGTITTIAGNGACTFGGDGGPATSASIYYPGDVALDSSGDLYIADTLNCRVRKVSGGTITTVAGTGTCGFTGDGGPATSANIAGSDAIGFDASDNLYIGGGPCYVRMVDSGGTITTVAGDSVGNCGFSGDSGPATSALLQDSYGLEFDASGNMYIADQNNCRVRMVDTLGTITSVVGNGACTSSGDGGPATSASIQFPNALVFDNAGNMYATDYGNCRVRKIDTGGTIYAFAGSGNGCGFFGDGGPAAAAGTYLFNPDGLTVDAIGDVFIADKENQRVRVVYGTKGGPTPTETATDVPTATPCPDLDGDTICDSVDTDIDGDGCPNVKEQQTAPGSQYSGGLRDYLDPWDYFNPTQDGLNKVDDILATVNAYFDDDDDGNPGLPPYEPGYNPNTDRANMAAAPNAWNTGAPDGLQRVQDILHSVKSYFHDCS
jgi:sugar lactone lactonase YvrE